MAHTIRGGHCHKNSIVWPTHSGGVVFRLLTAQGSHLAGWRATHWHYSILTSPAIQHASYSLKHTWAPRGLKGLNTGTSSALFTFWGNAVTVEMYSCVEILWPHGLFPRSAFTLLVLYTPTFLMMKSNHHPNWIRDMVVDILVDGGQRLPHRFPITVMTTVQQNWRERTEKFLTVGRQSHFAASSFAMFNSLYSGSLNLLHLTGICCDNTHRKSREINFTQASRNPFSPGGWTLLR